MISVFYSSTLNHLQAILILGDAPLIADLGLLPLNHNKSENYIVQTNLPKICEDILVLEIITILALNQRNNIVHFANTLQSSGRKKGSFLFFCPEPQSQLRLRGPSRRVPKMAFPCEMSPRKEASSRLNNL